MPESLRSSIVSALKKIDHYEVSFERQFKFPFGKDTISELYESSVWSTDSQDHHSFHKIRYLKSGSEKSLILAEQGRIYRYNVQENGYHLSSNKSNTALYIRNAELVRYVPFDIQFRLDEFTLKEKNAAFYILESERLLAGGIKCVTTIKVDSYTFLPVEQIELTGNLGKQQYSRYFLKNFKILESDSYGKFLTELEFTKNRILQSANLDSIKLARRELYKNLRQGDSAPAINGMYVGGGEVNSNILDDSIVILDFFYTSCAPCLKSVPVLNTIYREWNGKGVVILGINPFESDFKNIPAYIQQADVEYSLVQTPKQCALDYGVTGFPRLFVIRNGIVVKIYYGFSTDLLEDLGKLLVSMQN